MNCLAFEEAGEVIVVDCGVTFDDRGLGVDVVHPNFEALEPYRDRIRGVVVTHGHEDHIGALPYFLKRFDVPVWAPRYALGLIEERLKEHEVLEHARLIQTEPRHEFAAGHFRIEPLRVTHSIADATALAIRTDSGLVVHTGDFKFDDSPPDGEMFDVERLTELGHEGVSLLMSDSTNVDREGSSGSESSVASAMLREVENAEGAVIVSMFASNVHRLRILGEVAKKSGRRILMIGRSVHTHTTVARRTGYLPWPSDLVFPENRSEELPRNKILAIATGSQGEARAALSRLARDEHPAFKAKEGDTLLLSSRIIPGHEPEVSRLIDAFLRKGVRVRGASEAPDLHVSGHACRAEQQRMIELTRPSSFVPLHGTLHHLMRHEELAQKAGISRTCVLENGHTGILNAGVVTRSEEIPSGRVHIGPEGAIARAALAERVALAEGGALFVCAMLSSEGEAIEAPLFATRGLGDESKMERIIKSAEREVADALRMSPSRSDEVSRETVRLAARRVFARALGHKPVTVVTLVRSEFR